MRVDVGAFEGAAEGYGDVGADGDVLFFCAGHDGLEAREGFGDGAVCVLLGKGFGCGGED